MCKTFRSQAIWVTFSSRPSGCVINPTTVDPVLNKASYQYLEARIFALLSSRTYYCTHIIRVAGFLRRGQRTMRAKKREKKGKIHREVKLL